ncbi:hypothetical protein QBC38DRAFT_526934 [Podospora fimiseda]|uniref:Uncharacterized protein n=1 Tax=Podospora fimiseda TaxID=252190 RepID=A0AAN7BPY0_9PEZI|nr:hypothetical protein QBC38DRAFT_526934 [Podospora fimiseda]
MCGDWNDYGRSPDFPSTWGFDPGCGRFIMGLLAGICYIAESEAAPKRLVGAEGTMTRSKNAGGALALTKTLLGVAKVVKSGQTKATFKSGARTHYGRYAIWDLTGQQTCSTTYTCEYGQGFDQVCDNQRWGLDQLGLSNVFHYDTKVIKADRSKDDYKLDRIRHSDWRKSFGTRYSNGLNNGSRYRCEIDEFPMNSLEEAAKPNPQVVRAIDGNENGNQGNDFSHWLLATWYPCSRLLNKAPKITWAIATGTLGSDARLTAAPNQIIRKYGFDSSSGATACYPTYTNAQNQETVVSDDAFASSQPTLSFSSGIGRLRHMVSSRQTLLLPISQQM